MDNLQADVSDLLASILVGAERRLAERRALRQSGEAFNEVLREIEHGTKTSRRDPQGRDRRGR